MKPLPAFVFSSLAATAAAMSPGSGGPAQPASLTDQPAAHGSTDQTVINTYFDKGLWFATADKTFTMKLGAKIAFDGNFIRTNTDYENQFDHEQDGAKFRLARISGEGLLYEKIEYKWQYDMAGGAENDPTNNKVKDNKFRDLYIGVRDVCGGNLRVGQFKEPFSLEQLTGSTHTTFMERGATDRLVPGRNIGIMFHGACPSGRVNWAGGVFRDDGKETGENKGDRHAWTARVSGTPYKTDDTQLMHLGMSGRTVDFGGHDFTVDFSGETKVTKAQKLATFQEASERVSSVGFEAAWVQGPLSIQTEYVRTGVDRTQGGWSHLDGYYIYGSYFLTGESRNYSNSNGAFGRVNVRRPMGVDGGCGAWEVATRLSRLDLNSQSTASPGGRVDSFTAGINWYLNSYTRFMTNYNYILVDDNTTGNPEAQVVQFRIQVDV